MIIVFIWVISVKICKVNDSPNFAFAWLCCYKIPVVRPARPAKVISDLLDSSLQSIPHAFQIFEVGSKNHMNARSKLATTVFAFEIQELFCLLALSLLVWRRIGNLIKCNVSVWSSWFPLSTVIDVNTLLWPLRSKVTAKGETTDFKSSHRKRARWLHSFWQDCARNVLKGPSLCQRSIRNQNNSSLSRL